MYNTVIGVGAAVLLGGVGLYTAYELTRGDEGEAEVARVEDARAERRSDRLASTAPGRGGVPESERALDFGEGAEGDRVMPDAEAEARLEAERLAALGSGGLVDEGADDDLALGGAVSEDRVDDLRARMDHAVDDVRDGNVEGDVFAEAKTQADERAGETARGGLRGARPMGGAEPDTGLRAGRRESVATPVSTTRNARLTDKPDGVRTARNTPLVDKPDGRLARLVDKPDNSPYFAETDETRTFDPCVKADGTRYVGPGTAINPFADGDPCLPRATNHSFEVAAVTPRAAATTASDLGSAAPAILPFVDLVRPGFITAPPAEADFGSDYGT